MKNLWHGTKISTGFQAIWMSGTGEQTLTYPNSFVSAVSVVASNVLKYGATAVSAPYEVTLTSCGLRTLNASGMHYTETWKLVGMGY